MRPFSKLFLLSLTLLFVMCSVALAQDVIVAPSADDLQAIMSAIGGLKGASSLAIVAVVVQGLLLVFRSSFAKFSGAFQLLIVNGLTLVGAFVALKAQGMPVLAIITNAQVLTAAQVFVHQLIKQFSKAPAVQA